MKRDSLTNRTDARDIERHRLADDSDMEEGIELLSLAGDARRLFEKQSPQEKSRTLNFLVSNGSSADGELSSDFNQPFDLLAETAIAEAQKKAGTEDSDRLENWLPR